MPLSWRLPVLIAIAAGLGAGAPAASAATAGSRPVVREVVLAGDIDPVSARWVAGEIDAAARRGDAAVVIRIDTPGGLETSMRTIVQHELAAPIPVIAYVAPDGARAASAGVFVLMAADVAAMAPQTNVGSATPISSSGSNIGSDLRRKVVNDAASSLKALAIAHGRNGAWAEQAVRVASNEPAPEALAMHVVDAIAPDLPSLLRQLDGRRLRPKQGAPAGLVLHTAGTRVERVTLPLHLRVLETLIDPNIVFLLLTAGVLLLAFEVFHPGALIPGVAGGVMIVIALFGISVLPFTWAGLVLTLAGLAMLVAETHVGHGALGAAGVVTLVIGALMLFDTDGTPLGISIPLVIAVALLAGGGFVLVVSKTMRVRRLPPATGIDRLVGRPAEVREALAPSGLVYLNGELWQAIADGDAPVPVGADVVVAAVEGLTLRVHPAAAIDARAAIGAGRPEEAR